MVLSTAWLSGSPIDAATRETAMVTLCLVAQYIPGVCMSRIERIISCLGDAELRVRLATPSTLMALGGKLTCYIPQIEAVARGGGLAARTAAEKALKDLHHLPEAQQALDRLQKRAAVMHTLNDIASDRCSCDITDISIQTVVSWATAPARSTVPHCFLPGTTFRRASDGQFLRAAELCGAGGDYVLGPNGTTVLVRSAQKVAASERDLVKITIAGTDTPLIVTSINRILIKGPNGNDVPQPCCAADLSRMDAPEMFDGTTFCSVVRVDEFVKSTEVVEIQFGEDGAALAWLVPRRNRSRSVEPAIKQIAVLGKEFTFEDFGFAKVRTFIDFTGRSSPRRQRGRSADSKPDAGSLWSVDTRSHSDSQPDRCSICPTHHRYLRDTNIEGLHASKATPCSQGAACRKCHAQHSELTGRMRGPGHP